MELLKGDGEIGFGQKQNALHGWILLYDRFQDRAVILIKTSVIFLILGAVREPFHDPQAGHT
jgi:hypothetical protein